MEEALEYIVKVIKDCNAKLVVMSKSELAKTMALEETLNALGVKVVDVSAISNLRETIGSADVGITGANFGIAESGSIGIVSNQEADRLVSALPYIHIALLDSDNILPGLSDLKSVLRDYLPNLNERNNVVSLISGPSRTSDIEQQAILGVHGPNQIHVIVLEHPIKED
jgi:L-lactate utilization protein LutC